MKKQVVLALMFILFFAWVGLPCQVLAQTRARTELSREGGSLLRVRIPTGHFLLSMR